MPKHTSPFRAIPPKKKKKVLSTCFFWWLKKKRLLCPIRLMVFQMIRLSDPFPHLIFFFTRLRRHWNRRSWVLPCKWPLAVGSAYKRIMTGSNFQSVFIKIRNGSPVSLARIPPSATPVSNIQWQRSPPSVLWRCFPVIRLMPALDLLYTVS